MASRNNPACLFLSNYSDLAISWWLVGDSVALYMFKKRGGDKMIDDSWGTRLKEALEFLDRYPFTTIQAILDAKEKLEKKRGGR